LQTTGFSFQGVQSLLWSWDGSFAAQAERAAQPPSPPLISYGSAIGCEAALYSPIAFVATPHFSLEESLLSLSHERPEQSDVHTSKQPASVSADSAPRTPTFRSGALIFLAVCAIGLLQNLTPLAAMHWLYILQRLYYVPIVASGIYFGLRLSIVTALVAGAFFMAGTPQIWRVSAVDAFDQCLEVTVFLLVGLVTGILSDVQKRKEKELRHATAELNSVYVQLQDNFEGMKRAERLSALGQLSAGLAHEIRNPLASIEGAAVVVQRENQSAERRVEFLDIIQKECRRLDRLLSNFLDFAKPRRPQLSLVAVDQLLESVVTLVGHAKDSGRVQFSKRIPVGLSALECDSEQLKQVLLNLTMNAVQATPPGGVILLSAEQHEKQLYIDVSDPGVGIEPEDVDRIFDPFFTTKENGTGLGLSVAHQIVTQHGGSLTVSRNSPRGVTFRISLPLRPGK
jgi:signal transduction histidine kinase